MDIALPVAAAYLQPYLGVTAGTFVTGFAAGYTGSLIEVGTHLASGASLSSAEGCGFLLGAAFSIMPAKASSAAITTAATNAITSEATGVAAAMVTSRFSRCMSWFSHSTARAAAPQTISKTTHLLSHTTVYNTTHCLEHLIHQEIADEARLIAPKQIWSSTKKQTAVQNAIRHWQDHGKEFPELQNAKQYVEKAHSFLFTPTVMRKTRLGTGELLQYELNSNTFVVFTKEGIPKTMFKPKKGRLYFDLQ